MSLIFNLSMRTISWGPTGTQETASPAISSALCLEDQHALLSKLNLFDYISSLFVIADGELMAFEIIDSCN